jgi:hypothetical protein
MKINLVARIQDGGDGSQVVYLYNDKNDLVNNHYSFQEGDATAKEILDEENPYENGYICEVTLELDESGKLVKPVIFSGG